MQQALVEKRLLHLKMVQEEVTKPAKQLKVSIPIFEQIQEIHQEQSILLLLDRITTQAEITHLRDPIRPSPIEVTTLLLIDRTTTQAEITHLRGPIRPSPIEVTTLLLLDRITTRVEIAHLQDQAKVGAKVPAENRKKTR